MFEFDFVPANHDERTVEFLKRDFAILLKGIEGKSLNEINLDAVIEILERLKYEVENVKAGFVARDNFISYTMNPEDMSSVFAKPSGPKL